MRHFHQAQPGVIWRRLWHERAPRWLRGKELTCQCRRHKRHWSDLWVGMIPWEGNGNPLQCSCLKNPMDGVAWWVTSPQGCKELDTTKCTHTHKTASALLVYILGASLLLPQYSWQMSSFKNPPEVPADFALTFVFSSPALTNLTQ